MELDNIDRKILRLLQANGALSQVALAEQVGASSASCWRRIKAMENAGILKGTVRLVDAEAAGLPVNVLCHVRLTNHLPATSEVFETFLETRAEVVECYAVSGDWDYLLRVVAKDITSYEIFLRRHLLAHPGVSTASSNFALSQRKYTTALPI
ncbi:MAG TPA: Lrp/AsnC family transcriptional regulator [Sphingobium sp.]